MARRSHLIFIRAKKQLSTYSHKLPVQTPRHARMTTTRLATESSSPILLFPLRATLPLIALFTSKIIIFLQSAKFNILISNALDAIFKALHKTKPLLVCNHILFSISCLRPYYTASQTPRRSSQRLKDKDESTT